MSGVAGIFCRDGRPASAAIVERMALALAHRAPDGSRVAVAGPVALVHLALVTTPEESGEQQPLFSPEHALWITFDGRLDNRPELAHALGDPRAVEGVGDAGLVLRAYARWGEAGVARLIGDFAFALWDEHHRRLVCGRDQLGIRPFYYWADASALRFASEPRALFEDPVVAPRPNEGFIAECLAAEPVQRAETVFAGIMRLPPAHLLVADSDRLQITRYWNPDPPELVCRDDEEYGERFRDVFDRAVRARLRAVGPMAAHLSGGLDSSSIVATVAACGWAAAGFEAFALRFPGRPYDEGTYIEAVADATHVPVCGVQPPDPTEESLLASLERTRDLPDFPTGESLMRPLFERVRGRGGRVVLTGNGGDQWLSGSPYYYADLIRRGRWLTLVRHLHAAEPESELDWTLGQVISAGLFPLVPGRVRRLTRRALRLSRVPRWIDPRFARRTHLEDRLRAPALVWDHGGYARSNLLRLLVSGWEALTNELVERTAAWHGVECRHPFYDVRLVEFALSLPEEQRQRGRYTKVALRTAMRRRLPERVRLRTTKAEMNDIYLRAIAALGGDRALAHLAIGEAGWVDAARVRQMYEDLAARAARGDSHYGEAIIPLWMVVGVERWFRAIMLGESAGAGPSGRSGCFV